MVNYEKIPDMGRLHNRFTSIEMMSSVETRNGGEILFINYSFSKTIFGKVIIASTQKGVCHLFFNEDENGAISNLKHIFPNSECCHAVDKIQFDALSIFDDKREKIPKIKLHISGTKFQFKVWQALLDIPLGAVDTYGNIANKIGNPKASRAVGSAIGSNPVAFIVPCHRVIQARGKVGGYMWGSFRKSAILTWEAAKEEYNGG